MKSGKRRCGIPVLGNTGEASIDILISVSGQLPIANCQQHAKR
jgi:hypothetical protein